MAGDPHHLLSGMILQVGAHLVGHDMSPMVEFHQFYVHDNQQNQLRIKKKWYFPICFPGSMFANN